MALLTGLLLLAGLLLVLLAYGRYLRRTGDLRGLLLFWRKELVLTSTEFKLQRWGIGVLLIAVVLRFIGGFAGW